jgi:hypothetical protein
MIGEDFTMTEMIRMQFAGEENTIITWISNEEVINQYSEEAIRADRQDTRFDEEILRDGNVKCTQPNVNAIVEILGQLAV